jgi:TolB protein
MRLSNLPASFAATGALVALAAVAAPQAPQQAIPDIIITGARATRVAIAPCSATTEPVRTSCGVVREVLKSDLEFEGFQLIPESLMRSLPLVAPKAPNYVDWSSVGANILVTLDSTQGSADFSVDVRTFTVDGKASIMNKRYEGRIEPGNAASFRAFAHQAADDVLSLASIQGVARTRLTFVSDRDAPVRRAAGNAPAARGRKELYIADYDGFNVRRVTVNENISILPSWTPGAKGLIYTSYKPGTPQIFLSWIYEGRIVPNVTREPADVQAMAPVVSPDGKKIAYSSNRAGNFDIWVANIDGSGARNLTSTLSNDTAPCWSPSGLEIAFTSGRSGSAQLWVMDQEGLNVRRLSSVGNYNDGCAWNPSREFAEIAYSSRLEDGGFEIAVMDLSTGQVRQLTTGRGSCEYPTWAPNGRHLAFSCNRGGTWQLAVIDRMGAKLQTLSVGPGNSVQADWSQTLR